VVTPPDTEVEGDTPWPPSKIASDTVATLAISSLVISTVTTS
jgi:hypothetical protein